MCTLIYARAQHGNLALIFPFLFFFFFLLTCIRAYRKPGYFANIYRKILFLAYDNAGLFLGHSSPYFVFGIEYRNVTVGHAGYMQYICLPTCKHDGTSLRWQCRLYSVYTRNSFFFTRATRRRRNSKCVTRLFQWTTLLSKMYMRKTVQVGNIVQSYVCYDIYAPIMAILFADVKFTHSVTIVRFALIDIQKKINLDISVYHTNNYRTISFSNKIAFPLK